MDGRANGKKRSFLWGWLFLLIFGIPSIGGRGLHLFLADDADCSCRVRCDSSSNGPFHGSAGETSFAAEETAFTIQADSIPNQHDEESCFLCHFFTQPLFGASPAFLFFAADCAGSIQERPRLCLSAFPILHSGRSPPVPLF